MALLAALGSRGFSRNLMPDVVEVHRYVELMNCVYILAVETTVRHHFYFMTERIIYL